MFGVFSRPCVSSSSAYRDDMGIHGNQYFFVGNRHIILFPTLPKNKI